MDIAMLYEARPLLGFEATKAATLAALPGAQVLHFAGHGIQSLRLAPGDQDSSEEDRLLTAQEIAQLSLPNLRVVVLSACSTAKGEASRTEAPSSLARAFLISGATTVIGTLWPIDDSLPPEIFRSFHMHLKQGEDAATALRLALISYNDSMGQAGWDDIRTWASFQAIGS